MAHVAPWKKAEVTELKEIGSKGHVVAVAKLEQIPSRQMAELRRKLRKEMHIRVSRNKLLELALKEVADAGKPGVEKLSQHVEGQTALIVTDLNPFKLYKKISQSKAKAPAKAGSIAPDDIWVHKGETPFKPGPVVGELQQAGVPAAIEQGKVVIRQDKLLVKAGDAIPANVAAALAKLEILPMTVGLEVVAAWEKGTIYTKEILAVDDDAIRLQLTTAAANAQGLATEIAWPAPEVLPRILTRAVRSARAVAVESAFPAKDVLGDILAKAEAQALVLAARAPDLLDEATKAKLAAAAAPPSGGEASAPKKEDKKDEKVSEEEAAAGLGALFG